MSGPFVLFILSKIVSGSAVVTTQEFDSRASCQAAAAQLVKVAPEYIRVAFCVEK